MRDSFIKYNGVLGKQASIGPIPANQIVPWMLIVVVSYTVVQGFLGLGLGAFGAVSFWGIASWWLLTGTRPHQFINQWRSAPGRNWINANLHYLPLLPTNRTPRQRQSCRNDQVRVRLKPKRMPRSDGGHWIFMPFQNFVNLCCLTEIHKDGRNVAAYLLEVGTGQFQFVFAFKLEGLHDILTQAELQNVAQGLEEALKYLPKERLTLYLRCSSDDSIRQSQLQSAADGCSNSAIAILLRNEQKRVKQLTEQGKRQQWEQWVFVTWTSGIGGESLNRDWWSQVRNGLHGVSRSLKGLLGTIAGSKRTLSEQFYTQLLLRAYSEGFCQWEMLLNIKTGLKFTPCHKQEMWEWLWHRFNSGAAPEIPQVLQLIETDAGMLLSERINSEKHPTTVLIEGTQGRSACPSHDQQTDWVYLPGRPKPYCGVLVMEEAPAGWSSVREQVRWIWKCLSSGFVHDTEMWCEITPASDFLIRDNLARQAKQSKSAQVRAITKGQGRDVAAQFKQEESFEAQLQLYKGTKAVHCAPVFLVYREHPRQLDSACQLLANNFDSAKVIRESHIAWEVWLQTLPINNRWLLQDSNLVSDERRLTPTTQTVLGLMPLTVPRDLDAAGVEFLTERGGKPIYVDLFTEALRALIIGTSGSGKSVLAWRFITEALGQNIPVVGMDSSGKDSTFKSAIALLGSEGAYIDMRSSHSNLMEPPDLRYFPRAERSARMESWKEMVLWPLNIIAMGKLNSPQLAQRVEALLRLTLKVFLEDADIIERYNNAFIQGWQSPEWQHIPTLKDFRRYCTRERLNLVDFEDLDKRALNQICTQLDALFTSEVGRVLSQPSTFNPNPMIKFFALSGLKNESGQDAYLMAINAHAACIRTALSHPKSLFVGDEQSVLLKRDGFAQMVGDLCATGRKDGISVLLIAQDIDSIAQCSTASQILQNMNYRITGRITSAAIPAMERFLSYPPGVIARNAGDAAKPRLSDLSSFWLVEQDNRFWSCRYTPSEMALAIVANSQAEQAARKRVFEQYPDTNLGQLQALAKFTRQYIPALKQQQGLNQIGQPAEASPAASVQNHNEVIVFPRRNVS